MLVEDSADDERLMFRVLAATDAAERIVVARDGDEALTALFGRIPDEDTVPVIDPVVVIADLKLPKRNGIDVLKAIRANRYTCSLPFVILTSSDQESDIRESYQYGVNSYVCKPVTFAELQDAVRQIENYWLRTNVAPAPVRAI
ncbi:MAG: response regulator [Fimbriimonadaceae bacterium]